MSSRTFTTRLGSGLGAHRLEISEQARSLRKMEDRAPELRFDRLAFALHALNLLSARHVDVVVYRSRELQVQQGRDLRGGPQDRWALVGIPEDASPESIALVLTEIAGSPPPYALDAAVRASRRLLA